MFSKSFLALVLAWAAPLAPQTIPQSTAQAQPTIPDTPAGRTFKAWLEAFNSGDRALLDAYFHKYDPSKSVDNEMQFRGMTGSFTPRRTVQSRQCRVGRRGPSRPSRPTGSRSLRL